MKTRFVILALTLVTLILPGCGNTFHGAGQDLERAGQKMQKSF